MRDRKGRYMMIKRALQHLNTGIHAPVQERLNIQISVNEPKGRDKQQYKGSRGVNDPLSPVGRFSRQDQQGKHWPQVTH